MAKVCIVVPPVLSVARPNLGVALLKAELLRAGHSCHVAYANIWFAGEIGCRSNEQLAEKIDTRPLVAEWLFSFALYQERESSKDGAYLAYARQFVADDLLDEVVRRTKVVGQFAKSVAERVLADRPDIVGLSSSFQQNTAALAIAREVKKARPETIVCIGGANCEGPMGEALARNFNFLDAVFSGEADITFPRFADAVEKGQRDPAGSRVIQGAPVSTLDDLPTPDYADYFGALAATSLADEVRPTLLFESSRGCWWGAKHHCKFCGLNGLGMGYRSKTALRILQELEELSAQWNVRSFMAADNILNHRLIDEIFPKAAGQAEPPRYSLFYEIKSNIGYDKLSQLAAGGVRWVQPGIESLDDEVLSLMDKGVTAFQNIRLLRNCSELGIVPVWNLLRGFPGESDRNYAAMARVVPFLEHLSPPRGPFPIRLDRFSPYFEQAASYGFHSARPMPGYAAIYDLPESELRDIAYFFDDGDPGGRPSAALAEWIDAVAAWRMRHFSKDGAPVLAVVEAGPVAILRDTRSMARTEYQLLEPVHLHWLRGLRDPSNVDVVADRLIEQYGYTRTLVKEALAFLIELGALLIAGGIGVSLASDQLFSRARESRTDIPHPFGAWIPPENVALGAERSARTFNRGHL